MIGDRSGPSAPPNTPICVGVVDGQRLLAEGLAALIGAIEGFAVAGVAVCPAALPAIVAQHPDLVVVHVGAELTGPFELVRLLRSLAREIAIVIVTETLTHDLVRFVIDERLNALIQADATIADLVASLDRVAHGHVVLPAGWQGALAEARNDPVGSLSERKLEVLALIADGCSYDEIASRLFISPNTVKFHLRLIYRQLGVSNRMEAAHVVARSSRLRQFALANPSLLAVPPA